MTQMNLSTKQKQTHGQQNKLVVPRWGGAGMDWESEGEQKKPISYRMYVHTEVHTELHTEQGPTV